MIIIESKNVEEGLVPIYENETKEKNIKELIYTIRGKQVMLDSDVARLYQCETKYLNRVVKRNIERFPDEFCFQLKEEEYKSLRCQFVTLEKNKRGQHRKYMPYAFTEHGITMLAGLLNSDIAVDISIRIVKAFITMRKFLITNGQVFERLTNVEHKLLEHDNKINQVFDVLQKDKEEFKQKIFFKGQIWDSYELIINIIRRANKKIIIIDNYIDDTILEMLQKKNKNVEVVIITTEHCRITQLDIKKFNGQYPVLKIAKTDKFHDRFIIIDNKELYHCGASLKDLGKKCFGINKIEDEEYIFNIMKNI